MKLKMKKSTARQDGIYIYDTEIDLEAGTIEEIDQLYSKAIALLVLIGE